jgi:hypothetical protein
MSDPFSLLPSLRGLSATIPKIEFPVNPLVVAAKDNLASEFYKRLVEMIKDFDATLDQEHEVGVRLVTFGQTVVFHLTDMGYYNPSLLSFYGTMDDGSPVHLIQHVTQLSVLLMKVARKDSSKPKRSLGFVADCEPER